MRADLRLLPCLLVLLLAEGCSERLFIHPRPKTVEVAKTLARETWSGTWRCGQQDRNNGGYSDAVKGQACDGSVPEVARLVQRPDILAALRSPSGDFGVISTDFRVGHAASADAGITWLWQMADCTSFEETRGLRCFERPRLEAFSGPP